jgi:uncharacterized protein
VASGTPSPAEPPRCGTAPARDTVGGNTAGIGLKPEHYGEAVDCNDDGLWFEVHPENYMVAGGPRLAWLERVRARHALSLHGVALSLAADAEPDRAHLARLDALVRRFEPFAVSEHLAWSVWHGNYHPDLLPIPRSDEALRRVVDNVQRTQDALKHRILIENPSHYLVLDGHQHGEIEFLTELSCRTGCGLVLDVNNVWVSANNLRFDAERYIDDFPAEHVAEIHLAGHHIDAAQGGTLLIDSHDAPIAPEVWRLHARLLARVGPRPTLIERDANVPAFAELLAERAHAHAELARAHARPRVAS